MPSAAMLAAAELVGEMHHHKWRNLLLPRQSADAMLMICAALPLLCSLRRNSAWPAHPGPRWVLRSAVL